MIQRRSFLASILAAGMAPAFVGAKVLMPVKALVLPELDIITVHDSVYYGARGGGKSFTELVAETFERHKHLLVQNLEQPNVLFFRMKRG